MRRCFIMDFYAADWNFFQKCLNSKNEALYKEALTAIKSRYDNPEPETDELSRFHLKATMGEWFLAESPSSYFNNGERRLVQSPSDYFNDIVKYREQILKDLIFEGKITTEGEARADEPYAPIPASEIAFRQIMLTLFRLSGKLSRVIGADYSLGDDEPNSEVDILWLPSNILEYREFLRGGRPIANYLTEDWCYSTWLDSAELEEIADYFLSNHKLLRKNQAFRNLRDIFRTYYVDPKVCRSLSEAGLGLYGFRRDY